MVTNITVIAALRHYCVSYIVKMMDGLQIITGKHDTVRLNNSVGMQDELQEVSEGLEK